MSKPASLGHKDFKRKSPSLIIMIIIIIIVFNKILFAAWDLTNAIETWNHEMFDYNLTAGHCEKHCSNYTQVNNIWIRSVMFNFSHLLNQDGERQYFQSRMWITQMRDNAKPFFYKCFFLCLPLSRTVGSVNYLKIILLTDTSSLNFILFFKEG